MSMNKAVLMWLAAFFVGISEVRADELICQGYGYIPSLDGASNIQAKMKKSRFFFNRDGAIIGGRRFTPMDPAEVGLEGLAVTYFSEEDDSVLYLYQNDGKVEIGISHIDRDTDTIFSDKAMYTDCYFNDRGNGHVITAEVRDVEGGGSSASKTSLHF